MPNIESGASHRDLQGPQEKCGVTAILSKTGKNVSLEIPFMQKHLLNRGRDAAGMAVWRDGEMTLHKGNGEVGDVFPPAFDFVGHGLVADRGVGHNRYGTSGEEDKDSSDGAQPVAFTWGDRKLTLSYNGNLSDRQREILSQRIPPELPQRGKFDTQDIGNAIVSAPGDTWPERIHNGMDGVFTAYSLAILTDEGEVFGLRGPSGTWPLWVGESDDRVVFASEDRVDKSLQWSEVKPGELVQATPEGVTRTQLFEPSRQFRCSLHDLYGADPRSRMTEDMTYGEFRQNIGREIADANPIRADVYIPVPASGIEFTQGYVERLAEVFGEEVAVTDVIEKRDARKSFIGRDDAEVDAVINGKYAIPRPSEVRDKDVVTMDDSLIRGKTAGGAPLGEDVAVEDKTVKGYNTLLKIAGAKSITNIFAMPKFTQGCDQGYYIRENQLIAKAKQPDGSYVERTEEEIAKQIGANRVVFATIDQLEATYEDTYGQKEMACMSCVGGEHPLENGVVFSVKDLLSKINQAA